MENINEFMKDVVIQYDLEMMKGVDKTDYFLVSY